MKITKATQDYEAWLGRQLDIIPEDLERKHDAMRAELFPFLRATFYRWAQTWEDVCGPAARAPRVLAVGDLHVENFGTWRDVDGRLIWGINDFDEAAQLPYTQDLIRLATSGLIARMTCEGKVGIAAILEGYRDGVAAGGRPFALAEHHTALREMAVQRLHDPEGFWRKFRDLASVTDVPAAARKALDRMMPERGLKLRITHRIAGLGSLGRQRYVALADWRGGSVAREAKALAPSACEWAAKSKGGGRILYQDVLDAAVRCADPFVRVQKRWIVRRLAPDCSRIELSQLPKVRDELRLLHAMGFETANIHLGSMAARKLEADLKERGRGWLERAARAMEKAATADWHDYAKAAKAA